MKSILLIGLGRFGKNIAMKLYEQKQQVMAVDKVEEKVNAVLPYVTNAQIGDATNPEFEEDHVMTSMDGYTLDEGGEEGNMFDDSLADVEEDSYTSDDFSDDFGSDDM